MVNQLISHY